MTTTANHHHHTSISRGGKGPQLLLLSLAGAGTAAGVSFTRWLFNETGEIILVLFSTNNNNGAVGDDDHYCDDDAAGGGGGGGVNYHQQHHGEEASFEDDIPDIIASCCISSPSTSSSSSPSTIIEIIGQSLLTISSSPHLRVIPVFLILLSSTTFLIGIILTQKQFSRVLSNYHEYIHTSIMTVVKTIFGEEISDEMEVLQRQRPTSLRDFLSNLMLQQKQQTTTTTTSMSQTVLTKVDNLVMDEYIRWFIQSGVEMVLGLGGGIALYSLPETLFSSSSSSCDAITSSSSGRGDDGDNDVNDDSRNKSAIVRRRLIHAADPWLERVLFSPGGMWDVFPSGWRECLTDPERKQKNVVETGRQEEVGVRIKMIDDTLDTTQETLVGTEISATSVGSTDNESDDDGHEEDEFAASTPTTRHHAPPMSSVEMKTNYGGEWKTSSSSAERNGIRSPREESVGEALYATICDVVASNLANAFQSKEVEERNRKRQQQQSTTTPPSPPPSPQEQIEKILHRTTIAATTIFLSHFLTSPTTRRSWMSAIKFLTSAGLFSTAISAGIASHLLRSSSDTTAAAASTLLFGDSAMMNMLCSKIYDWTQQVSSSSQLYFSLSLSSINLVTISSKMRVIFHRLREEIKKNKRLQATLALMVLYGVKKQLSGRRKNHSGGVKSRRVR